MTLTRILAIVACVGIFLLSTPLPAAAGDGATQDAALVMADWLFLSYMVFFGAALVVFLVALKRGMFRNLEESKYHILTIHEPDYYTPDWAKEDVNGTDR